MTLLPAERVSALVKGAPPLLWTATNGPDRPGSTMAGPIPVHVTTPSTPAVTSTPFTLWVALAAGWGWRPATADGARSGTSYSTVPDANINVLSRANAAPVLASTNTFHRPGSPAIDST